MNKVDEKRIKRILERPGACTMDNVLWLVSVVTGLQQELTRLQEELAQLKADHALEVARAIAAEEEVASLHAQLDWRRHQAVAATERVLR